MKTLLVALLALCISTFAASKKSTKDFNYSDFLEANNYTKIAATGDYLSAIEYIDENLKNYENGDIKFRTAGIMKNDLIIMEWTTNEIKRNGLYKIVEMYQSGTKISLVDAGISTNETEFILGSDGKVKLYDATIRDELHYIVYKKVISDQYKKQEYTDSDTYTLISKIDSTFRYGNKKFKADHILSYFVDKEPKTNAAVNQVAFNCNTHSSLIIKKVSFMRIGPHTENIKQIETPFSKLSYGKDLVEACKESE